jgi:hypothetical protein
MKFGFRVFEKGLFVRVILKMPTEQFGFVESLTFLFTGGF